MADRKTFENEKTPIRILVVGKDPFGKVLEKTFAKGKVLHGRSGRDRALGQATRRSVDAHVVFAAGLSTDDRSTADPSRSPQRPVLLVGETPGFAAEGACVNFYIKEKPICASRSTPSATKRGGITISSELHEARQRS